MSRHNVLLQSLGWPVQIRSGDRNRCGTDRPRPGARLIRKRHPEFHVNTKDQPADTLFSLSVDLLSAKVLVWIASVGRDAELTPEAHIYFFDRYRRLAQYHRSRGRVGKATRFQAKAEEHYRAGSGGDGPPYAAAMAMPRPNRFIRTDAVSRSRMDGPDDAA